MTDPRDTEIERLRVELAEAERDRDAARLLLEQCRSGGALLGNAITMLRRERDESRTECATLKADLARVATQWRTRHDETTVRLVAEADAQRERASKAEAERDESRAECISLRGAARRLLAVAMTHKAIPREMAVPVSALDELRALAEDAGLTMTWKGKP